MTKVDDAVGCLARGSGCIPAVVSSCCDLFGIDQNLAYRVSTPFGVGMGRMCEMCGAVMGTFVVIGLKYGRASADDKRIL